MWRFLLLTLVALPAWAQIPGTTIPGGAMGGGRPAITAPPPVAPPQVTRSATSWEPGYDRPGGDLGHYQGVDAQWCRATCDAQGKCAAWTWVQPGVFAQHSICWLKHVVPQPVANPCCISGARP